MTRCYFFNIVFLWHGISYLLSHHHSIHKSADIFLFGEMVEKNGGAFHWIRRSGANSSSALRASLIHAQPESGKISKVPSLFSRHQWKNVEVQVGCLYIPLCLNIRHRK